MKITAIVFFLLCFLTPLASVRAEENLAPPASVAASAPEVSSEAQPELAQGSWPSDIGRPQELVDLKLARALARIDVLERRIAGLERDSRFQDERIRNMDRTISDLRRRSF